MDLFGKQVHVEVTEIKATVDACTVVMEKQHKALCDLVTFIDGQNERWERMALRVEALLTAVISMHEYLSQQQQKDRPIVIMHRGFEPD